MMPKNGDKMIKDGIEYTFSLPVGLPEEEGIWIGAQPCKDLGLDKCERCRNWSKMPWPIKVCEKCQMVLEKDYPEVYEKLRQENIRLWDKLHKEGK